MITFKLEQWYLQSFLKLIQLNISLYMPKVRKFEEQCALYCSLYFWFPNDLQKVLRLS